MSITENLGPDDVGIRLIYVQGTLNFRLSPDANFSGHLRTGSQLIEKLALTTSSKDTKGVEM